MSGGHVARVWRLHCRVRRLGMQPDHTLLEVRPASARLVLQGLHDPQLLPVDRNGRKHEFGIGAPPLPGLSVTGGCRRSNRDDRIDVSAHWPRLCSIAFNQLGDPFSSVYRGLMIL